jgi:hypothetical protein
MVCTDCGDQGAECLTAERVRVCVSCLYERTARERDALRDELTRIHRLAPVGLYTVSAPHEEEILRLRAEVVRYHDSLREADRVLRQAYAERDEELEELEALQAHIREHLPYKYDDGEDDDASPEECVEYAAREIRELKSTNQSLQQSFDAPDGGPMARAIARSSYHVEQQARRKAEAERDEARAEEAK